jgi:hypothetical protein
MSIRYRPATNFGSQVLGNMDLLDKIRSYNLAILNVPGDVLDKYLDKCFEEFWVNYLRLEVPTDTKYLLNNPDVKMGDIKVMIRKELKEKTIIKVKEAIKNAKEEIKESIDIDDGEILSHAKIELAYIDEINKIRQKEDVFEKDGSDSIFEPGDNYDLSIELSMIPEDFIYNDSENNDYVLGLEFEKYTYKIYIFCLLWEARDRNIN